MPIRKKKVLYLITKSNWGGAQKYVFDLATNLPKNQFEVAVACGGSGELVNRLHAANIRVVSISSLGRDIKIFSDFVSLLSIIGLLIREQPDVLHISSSKAGGLGAVAGRITFVPHVIFTSHGLAYDEHRSWWARWLMFFFTWLTFVFAHSTIQISKNTYQRAQCLPLVKKKVHLIYNGLLPLQLESRDVARNKLATLAHKHFQPSTVWIGTISELVKNKGLSYMIEACSTLKQAGYAFVFFIMGTEGSERIRLESLISKHQLSEHVFILGFVPDASQLLSAFDIFTLTSVKEGHPYVLLEAAKAELAVIGSDIAGIQDIVTNQQTGLLVEPKNIKEINQALTYLLENSNEARRMGAAFQKEAAHKFSFERMLEKTLVIYNSRS